MEPVNSRIKLTIPEQVAYMRDQRGVKFNITTEEQAAEFLETSNYYFKVKAFEKNYSTYKDTEKNKTAGLTGKYCNLEFAYLQELSTLDMYFREMVLSLCLDVEHFLRVALMRDISANSAEDGYSIVQQFLEYHPNVTQSIEDKKHSSFSEQLIDKYAPNYPVWVLVEILSFGDLINFCDLYYNKYPSKVVKIGSLRIVKFLRNAAAHNNCLLNNLNWHNNGDFPQSRDANNLIKDIPGISAKTRSKKMQNRTIHDFVVLLCVFSTLVSSQRTKEQQFLKLQAMFSERFHQHDDYFDRNPLISTSFDFLEKIIDNLAAPYV